MNLVIVKHENCGQKYLFKVPDKESVYAGNLVLVSNRRGQTLATCLCDSFSMEEGSNEYKAILTAFGATEPLASVVGKYYYSKFNIPAEPPTTKEILSKIAEKWDSLNDVEKDTIIAMANNSVTV